MTNTVQQIIAAAIAASAETFRQALIKQDEMHDDYASLARNPLARRGDIAQRDACLAAYDDVGFGAINDICDDMGKCVVALNVACKLLGISPAKRTAAIVAWQETLDDRARRID